jgi:radical SAM superfamily enzyme YgiQ (UPF0313 family)
MLYFYDDNLFGDKDYSFKLFEALKDTKLGRWGVHADISVSQDPKLLDLICSNGTPYLAIGFETLSKKNAQTLGNKMKTDFLSKYDESVCILKKRGIEVAGSFMFGFPGDSQSKLEQVLAFIKKHKIKGYITRYSVIPGSQLYDEVLTDYQAAKGRLTGTSTTKARTLNQFFMAKNGFRFEETEDIIINALKPLYKTKLPLPQIDALAVFRSFFY